MKRTTRWALAAAGAAFAVAAVAHVAYWRWRETYFTARTRFGRARIYQVLDDDGRPVRLLEVNGIVQSGTYVDEDYVDLVFEYLKTYDLMFQAGRPIKTVCVLGCGGYDYPEHLVATRPDVTVSAVEVGPVITNLARRFFFLDRLIEEYATEQTGQLRLIEADALAHLQATDGHYDAIVNDAFDGGTPPAHLTTDDFARTVHDHLGPGGLYLTNIVAPLAGSRAQFLWDQVAILRRVFTYVHVFPVAGGDKGDEDDNVVVVATDAALPQALAARSL